MSTVVDTPPDTIIDSAAHGTTSDTTPSFAFHSTEAGSTFECSIDTGTASFGPCSGPGATHTPASPLADGAYTFRVRATDSDGTPNTDPSPATETFTVRHPARHDHRLGRARDDQRHHPELRLPLHRGGLDLRMLDRHGDRQLRPLLGPRRDPHAGEPAGRRRLHLPGAGDRLGRHAEHGRKPRDRGVHREHGGRHPARHDHRLGRARDDQRHHPELRLPLHRGGLDLRMLDRHGDRHFGPCSGPGATHTPASPLAAGAYTFRVRATDGEECIGGS